jgi:hypothetical protein
VKLKRSALGALIAATLVGSSFAIGTTAASGDPSANVTICHRTDSDTNPYVQITVDESAVDGLGGGNDHLGAHTGPVWDPTLKAQHIKWGDIIPPVDEHGDPRPDPTLIANWPAGQDIFDNGCVVPSDVPPPAPRFGDLVVTKEIVGTPTGASSFTVHVLCDDDSVDEDVVFTSNHESKTYSDIREGINCTVEETDSGGATVSYDPTGVATDGIDIVADTENDVTVTNTFTPVTPDGPIVAPETVSDPGTGGAPVAVAPAAVAASPQFTG